jgi:hypothetical protein
VRILFLPPVSPSPQRISGLGAKDRGFRGGLRVRWELEKRTGWPLDASDDAFDLTLLYDRNG